MRSVPCWSVAAALLAPAPLTAQSVQYRSPAGVTYVAQSDTGAVARAQAALATDPRNVDLIVALGTAQAGVRQFREAIETFSRGLAQHPDHPLLLRWRGHRYLSVREFPRAFADLNRGAQRDSTIYGIWYHLGVLKFRQGDFAGAVEAFTRARTMPPNPGERAASYDWLWMSLRRAGRTSEAALLLAAMPDSVITAAGNAYARRLLLYRGTITPAQVFTPADTGDVAVATLAYGVGNWYLVRGDTALAREWFERAVASRGWPAFGFIVAEVELARLR